MLVIMVGSLIMLKMLYNKAKPGEVIVLNTLEREPRIIRNGTLVMPIIHSAKTISLNTQAIPIEQSSIDRINELYSLNINTISVQIQNTDAGIIKAYERMSEENGGVDTLKSVLEHSIQEGLHSFKDYDGFKQYLSEKLNKVGYELVV